MHRMKIGGSTPFHNHGDKTSIFVLPLTEGLIEETYLHNIVDFSKVATVDLYSIGTKRLNAGEISFGTGNLIHKVSNSSESVQSFIEIYFPVPKNVKIYLPYYNEQYKYIQIKPIQTHLPYYKSVSKGEIKAECTDLLKANTEFIAFTSTGYVIEDRDMLESYYEEYGCEYVEKMVDNNYVIASPESKTQVHDDL